MHVKTFVSVCRAISLLAFVITVAGVGYAQTADPINGSATFVGKAACPAGGVSGATCYNVTVQCSGIDGSGVPSLSTLVKVNNGGSSKGTVILTAAGGANAYYDQQFAYGGVVVNSLLQAGYTVVQPRFSQPGNNGGWLTGPAPDGPRALACRYAALASWIYTSTSQRPLIHKPNTAMCATAVSGSTSAIVYALAHFGMGTGATRIFDMVEIVSGPTFSHIDHGCICDQPPIKTPTGQGTLSECFRTAQSLVDGSYPGKYCSSATKTHDQTNASLFAHDSIVSDDAPFLNYTTNVHAVFGGADTSDAIPQAFGWINSITSPVIVNVVPDAAHFVPDTLEGAVRVASDLTGSCALQH